MVASSNVKDIDSSKCDRLFSFKESKVANENIAKHEVEVQLDVIILMKATQKNHFEYIEAVLLMKRNFSKKENNTNISQKNIPEKEYPNIFSIYIITYSVQEGVTY